MLTNSACGRTLGTAGVLFLSASADRVSPSAGDSNPFVSGGVSMRARFGSELKQLDESSSDSGLPHLSQALRLKLSRLHLLQTANVSLACKTKLGNTTFWYAISKMCQLQLSKNKILLFFYTFGINIYKSKSMCLIQFSQEILLLICFYTFG